jgi:Outer membrane protein beta-barrel domain
MHQLLAINFSLWKFFSVGSLALAIIICSEVKTSAQSKVNSIGPTITFGSGSSTFGVEGKLRLTENVFKVKNALSLRPFLRLPSNGIDVGAGVTYDFDLLQSGVTSYAGVTPYAGIGLASINSIATTVNPLGGPGVSTPFNQISFYGQAGVEINAGQNLSLSGSLQVPFNNRLNTTFTVGANYRF